MTRLSLVLVLWGWTGGGAPKRAADPWFGADKWKHFLAASAVQTAAYAAWHESGSSHRASLWRATAATAVVSLGKEVHDRARGGDFSARDLVWDAAGAGAASSVIIQVHRR